METTTISRRALRKTLIDHDLSMKKFAQMVGISHRTFYTLMETDKPFSRLVTLRIHDVLERLGDPPPESPEGVVPNVRAL